MLIYDIKTENFRNLQSATINFSKKLNVIFGDNAMGKTNLLESIYLCCIGKSPRADTKELISFDAPQFSISLNGENRYGKVKIDYEMPRVGRKKICVDGMPLAKASELLSNIICVYFSPEQLKLIKEAPDLRRKFLDVDISQLYKVYFNSLSNYNKILAQRNNLLKNIDFYSGHETLSVWNNQLAKEGLIVCDYRKKFLERLSPFAEKVHKQLCEGEKLSLTYQSTIEGINTIAEYCALLDKNLQKDIYCGYTTVGVHRDDIKILLDDKDVKVFASQGQQRSVALSMIVGECYLVQQICGEMPILLLDDVLSELDISRQKNLVNICKDMQTFMTCAVHNDQLFDDEDTKYLCVQKGKIFCDKVIDEHCSQK